MRIIKLKHFFFILRNIKRKVKTIAVVFSMFYFLVKLVSYSKRNDKKKFKESNEVVDHTMDKKLAKDLGFQKSYCLKPECYDMRMN